jgi:hypothetical protein
MLAAGRSVTVLAPASLRKNFEQEVVMCGGDEFSQDRMWSVASPDGDVVPASGTGDPGVPYNRLTDGQRSRADAWLRALVRERYRIIGYNGLTKKGLKALTAGGTTNPFDNGLVIVDEVHNLTRSLANAKTRDTVKFELYNLVLDARRCKVVVLSGSPAINTPFEFTFMANMLRGRLVEYEVKWARTLLGSEVAKIKAAFMVSRRVDRSMVTASGATVTTCPDGFEFVEAGKITVKGAIGSNIDHVLKTMTEFLPSKGAYEAVKYEALPSDRKEFDDIFVDPDTGDLIRQDMMMRRLRGTVSFYDVRDRSLYPTTEDIVVKVPISAIQYTEYTKARVKERQLEDKIAKEGEETTTQNVHKTYSRPILNFVFPVEDGIRKWRQDEVRADLRDGSASGEHDTRAETVEYKKRLSTAVAKLMESDVWTDDAKLLRHSPKFSMIYAALMKCVGKSMIYSAFRTLEGAGLMMALLNSRGWQFVTVEKVGGALRLKIEGGGAEVDGRCRRYICPQPSSEEGAALLKIFNGQSDTLEEPLRTEVRKRLGDDNTYGQGIDTVILTKSGAEGISLTCVREVHIMEPHYNSALMSQVKGRAVRLRSHMDLEEHERTVKMTTYVATFSQRQRDSKDFARTRERDKGLTSDEALAALALRKDDQIGQLMRMVRNTAVDCLVHADAHNASGTLQHCYMPPSIYKTEPMMPANIRRDRPDPMVSTKGRVVELRDPTGAVRLVLIIAGKTEVYDAQQWKAGVKTHVANVTDDGTKLTWV